MHTVADRPSTTAEFRRRRKTHKLFTSNVDDIRLFENHFDHTPFEFRHMLHERELFQLPALVQLAERLARKNGRRLRCECGTPDGNGPSCARPEGRTVVDALQGIHEGKNWVILQRMHEDPLYRDALDSMVPELSALAGVDIRYLYAHASLTAVVTSPGHITPYRMDGTASLLAQIQGTKLCYLYDGNDPEILSQEDLGRYWTGNLPKIDYPAGVPRGHWQFQLKPGNGVFHPVTFPHWLQNGPDVSVSVSLHFRRRRDAAVGAHRMNHFARKLGLKPLAPGRSPALDRLKQATFGSLYEAACAARGLLRRQTAR